MATHHPIRKHVPVAPPEIPDKLYFRIGDVARLCEVPAYVLRFWETEFPQLKPNKGGTGQRLYRRRDVEMALRIKSLLYDQGYTIPGARQVFKNDVRPAENGPVMASLPAVESVVEDVVSLPTTESAMPAQRLAEFEDPERNRKLNALRAEMRSLLQQLSRPVAVQAQPEARVQPLRPLLVLEKPAALRTENTLRPKLQLTTQRDLFGVSDDNSPIAG